jgi:hypothetical protein
MKHVCISLILLLVLLPHTYTLSATDMSSAITCFTPRSQSFNNIIKNAGMDPVGQYQETNFFNGTLKGMFAFDQSFRDNKLGLALFGPAVMVPKVNDDVSVNNRACHDGVVINIVGTTAITPPNGTTDLIAENFFLPKDYQSSILLKPTIQNFSVHFQAYFGFDDWCTGLYSRIYFPITYSRWTLEAIETPIGTATTGFAVGEVSSVEVPAQNLFINFLEYAAGGQLTMVPGGQFLQALNYTRFGGLQRDHTTRIADMRAELGWNFLLSTHYHVGAYLTCAIPTGKGCGNDCNNLLWGAKVGNGNHWELGGGLTAHYTLWNSADDAQRFDFYADATLTHLFQHTVKQTCDLKNKPLSRYIIAEQLITANSGLLVGNMQATLQFSTVYAPVANFSTVDVTMSIPLQADLMAKLVYTCNGFSWSVGYDFWGQTCPDTTLHCENPFPSNRWALRGDAHVYGFINMPGGSPAIPLPVSYAATTPFSLGTPFQSGTPPNANGGIDNATTPVMANNNQTVFVAPGGTTQIFASNPPITITPADINVCGANAHGISNSFFTEINYMWQNVGTWKPYLGVGVRAELGSNSNTEACTTTTTNDNTNEHCLTTTVSAWGVWLQCGTSF